MKRSELRRAAAGLGKSGPVRLHRPVFPQPRQSLLKNMGCSGVWWHGYSVMHPTSFASYRHNSCASQVSEVPGNLWLRLVKDLGEVADANLLISHEIEQAQPSHIS